MLCLKKKIILIGSFIFSLVFVSVLLSSSCYAIADISVTYTQNQTVTNWSNIFPDCTGSCLGNYRYLIVSMPDSLSDNNSNSFLINANFSGTNYLKSISSNIAFSIYEFPFDGSSSNALQWRSNYSFSHDTTFILTSNYLSCPEPEEPDCPPSETPYDDKFDQLIRAIYVTAGTMIVLYFFYCLYRLIIKNTGGN